MTNQDYFAPESAPENTTRNRAQQSGSDLIKKSLIGMLLLATLLCLFTLSTSLTPPPVQAAGNTYYLAPNGNDSGSGSSSSPWKTFDRAWQALYPGDTLILKDGVYFQSLRPNQRNGTPGNPITIRAQNDGQAIIDGEGVRDPVYLGDTWPGPIGDWFVIEGVIARNASDRVFYIRGENNVLRRVSGYNANKDDNSHVFMIWSDNNLIEDCIAGGTGRKMILLYEGSNNIVRRCFVQWDGWDGRDFCGVGWPWGDGVQIYSGDNNIIENTIVYGQIPAWAVSIQANDPSLTATGNKVLGTMALMAGMNLDNTVKSWPTTRPSPTECPEMVTDFNWPGYRSGFMLYGQGLLKDNLIQDFFAWGNAGLGITSNPGTSYNPNNSNNVINHVTLFGNGIDNPDGPWPGKFGGPNTDAVAEELEAFSSVQNSYIETLFNSWNNYPGGSRDTTTLNGPGARLTTRYVDGVLTNEPLWPWPMEGRVQNELGYSLTGVVNAIIGIEGFNLIVNPTNERMEPGETIEIDVTLQPTGGFSDTISVTASSNSPDLQVSPTSSSVPNGTGHITLTLTDLTSPSSTEAVWHTVTVTASANGISRQSSIYLLVNGKDIFLPVVIR